MSGGKIPKGGLIKQENKGIHIRNPTQKKDFFVKQESIKNTKVDLIKKNNDPETELKTINFFDKKTNTFERDLPLKTQETLKNDNTLQEISLIKKTFPEVMQKKEDLSYDKFPKEKTEIENYAKVSLQKKEAIWNVPTHWKNIFEGKARKVDIQAKLAIIEMEDGSLHYGITSEELLFIKRWQSIENPSDISLEGINLANCSFLRDPAFLQSAPVSFLNNLYESLPKKAIFGFLEEERIPIIKYSNLDVSHPKQNKININGLANAISEGFIANAYEEKHDNKIITHRALNHGPLRDHGIDIHVVKKEQNGCYRKAIKEKEENKLPLSARRLKDENSTLEIKMGDITSANGSLKQDFFDYYARRTPKEREKAARESLLRNSLSNKLSLKNLKQLKNQNGIKDKEHMIVIVAHDYYISCVEEGLNKESCKNDLDNHLKNITTQEREFLVALHEKNELTDEDFNTRLKEVDDLLNDVTFQIEPCCTSSRENALLTIPMHNLTEDTVINLTEYEQY